MFREGSAADPDPGHQPSCSRAPPGWPLPILRGEWGLPDAVRGFLSPLPWRAPPFLPGRAGADARRRREVKSRVWAARGAAQLRAEVQLEAEGAGWRRSPWGFG